MSDKPFKTYSELVAKLREEKNLAVPDEDEVIRLLKKHSYFALVSGYKNLFKGNDGKYRDGTTINDISALFDFDNRLRDIFFHSIQIVEKHIKSLLSYAFVEKYGDSSSEYLITNNYDYVCQSDSETQGRLSEVIKLVTIFSKIISPPFEHKYIEHQFNKHGNVPLWVTMKAVTLGTASKMYSLCTRDVQSSVSKEFPAINQTQLAGMLDYLTRVRNACAHNERLYDFKSSNKRAIPALPIHQNLRIKKIKSYYVKGQDDLFAAMICLKYLLSDDEYKNISDQIKDNLDTLHRKTNLIPPNKIICCMGFPPNWYDTVNMNLTNTVKEECLASK